MLPVAGLLAGAGLIVGTFSLTGLGLKISSLIMSLSFGYTTLALFLALMASMIVGLSLPITATYIMTVVMVAPALVKVGVPEHVAHMLAFYFAVLSEVSPPVGLSPSAAAAVTGGNPFGAMMQAWKYSLPAFLVPFMFAASAVGANLLIVGANRARVHPGRSQQLRIPLFCRHGDCRIHGWTYFQVGAGASDRRLRSSWPSSPSASVLKGFCLWLVDVIVVIRIYSRFRKGARLSVRG